RLQRGVDHPAADLATGPRQRADILDVERGKAVEDPLVQVVVGNEVLERLRRRGITARHGNTEIGQVADHLAERGILAADTGQVVEAQRVQPEDVLVQAGSPRGPTRRPARPSDMIAPAPDPYKVDPAGFSCRSTILAR